MCENVWHLPQFDTLQIAVVAANTIVAVATAATAIVIIVQFRQMNSESAKETAKKLSTQH